MVERQAEDDQVHPLIGNGWFQGVMFDAPGASYNVNVLGNEGAGLVLGTQRPVRKDERLVLISHACDIVSRDEKYAEALICKRREPNLEILGRWDKNSSTYFVVDPDAAYVANASHRVKVDKNSLLEMTHHGCMMDDLRRERFVQWLARRYDRPIVPNYLYRRFHTPVYASFASNSEADWAPWRTFNQAIHDIRIYLPSETAPPYSVGMVYVARSVLTEEQVNAVFDVHHAIVDCTGDDITIIEPPVITELDEMPYGVVRRTQPLIIEYPSWDDEDAAPPIWLSDRQTR